MFDYVFGDLLPGDLLEPGRPFSFSLLAHGLSEELYLVVQEPGSATATLE